MRRHVCRRLDRALEPAQLRQARAALRAAAQLRLQRGEAYIAFAADFRQAGADASFRDVEAVADLRTRRREALRRAGLRCEQEAAERRNFELVLPERAQPV